MNRFETDMLLDKFGIDAPDKCKSCIHVVSLLARLSAAQDRKDRLVTLTQPDVMLANIRARLPDAIRKARPDLSDDVVAESVERSIPTYLNSERHAKVMEEAREQIVIAGQTAADTSAELHAQISLCSPDGCGSV